MDRTNRLRSIGYGALGVLLLVVLWDAYAAWGPENGWSVGDLVVAPRSNEFMPHSWEIVQRLTEPVGSAGGGSVLSAVWSASLFTLGLATKGWVIGVAVGLLLAVLMTALPIAEKGFLPWIVLSQTVPLIALAPLVDSIGASFTSDTYEWSQTNSVAIISAYLAFFAVAVGALRGFKAPQATHLELMQAYGAGWWKTFFTLRLPASVPFLLPALRLAAASAVIGAVVAEVSMNVAGGLGRMFVEYSAVGSADPAKTYAPVLGAVVVGLVAAGVIALISRILRHYKLTGGTA